MNSLTLNECLVVYAIKNEVNIKKGDYIEKEDIYTFVGVDIKGFRSLINVYPDRKNNNRYWLDCFETLKARGLKNILFLSVDDNKNMKRAAKVAFSSVVFVDSITDIMPKFYKFSFEKNAREIGSKIHSLYVQKTLTDYKDVFDKFKARYNNAIHQRLIEKYLSNVEYFYKFSENIRKLIFKHSANVGLYDKIRLSFNSNNTYINSIDDIFKALGSLNNYFGFTSFKKSEWILILSDLIQIYPDLELI